MNEFMQIQSFGDEKYWVYDFSYWFFSFSSPLPFFFGWILMNHDQQVISSDVVSNVNFLFCVANLKRGLLLQSVLSGNFRNSIMQELLVNKSRSECYLFTGFAGFVFYFPICFLFIICYRKWGLNHRNTYMMLWWKIVFFLMSSFLVKPLNCRLLRQHWGFCSGSIMCAWVHIFFCV